MTCKADGVGAAVRAVAGVVAEHRVELIELDRAIGDGDHGENMNRGFTAVVAALDAGAPETPGAVLKLVATTLISKVGGAAGSAVAVDVEIDADATANSTEGLFGCSNLSTINPCGPFAVKNSRCPGGRFSNSRARKINRPPPVGQGNVR